MRARQVNVLLFAGARDAFGSSEVLTRIPLEGTAADVVRHLEDAFPGAIPFLKTCRVAVNQEFADLSEVIPEGAEVALIPPVSGG
jgi:molybdopterin converting factor subunit 1